MFKKITVLAALFLSPANSFAITIAGSVLDLDGNGITSVAVQLTGSSTTLHVTDNSGTYSFPGLVSGSSYTVTPVLAGSVFTPSSRFYSAPTTDQLNQNFTRGKIWSGSINTSASNANNWVGGELPVTDDIVRFDGNAVRECLWNLNVDVSTMELVAGFVSTVTVAIDLDIGTIRVAAGEIDFGTHFVDLSRDFIHTGGKFSWDSPGTLRWVGSTTQIASMVATPLGNHRYESYFHHFRVNSSSTVRATSDLVIDGTFNISTGRFEAGNATHTMTGGTQVGAAASNEYLWFDSGNSLDTAGGTIVFDGTAGSFKISQSGGNVFNNLTVRGSGRVITDTNLIINGALSIADSSSAPDFELSGGFTTTVYGPTQIGPSGSASPAFLVGLATVNFVGPVVVGTATWQAEGGRIVFREGLAVGPQGLLSVQAGSSPIFQFWSGKQFFLNGGTLRCDGPSVFTSTVPGTARYSASINGTVDIDAPTIFESLDVNGFHMGLGANPVSLNYMDFRFGPTGGAAINFNPVTVSSVSIDSAQFDSTISTNVRAILNTAVVPTSNIEVTWASGTRAGVAYEYDPSSTVHWGTLGTPTGVAGTALDTARINWNWTRINKPLGFVVIASSGGPVSATLTFSATTWTEVGLSADTCYSRQVQAFTDSATADSTSASRCTQAALASSASFNHIGVSSITLSWAGNGNPSDSVYRVERSSGGSAFTQIASGTIAQLVPYSDIGLLSFHPYTYRIKSVNKDNLVTSGSTDISTTTRPVPPPAVAAISPSSATNLGLSTFLITGSNFKSGATVLLKNGSTISIVPEERAVLGVSSITATFNLTGRTAGLWDVYVENSDGLTSVPSGSDLLLITNATSTGNISIGSYLSSQSFSIGTLSGDTTVTMQAGAMTDARIYLSNDPENSPLSVDSDLIDQANDAVSGVALVPGTIREINAYTAQGQYTLGFSAPVTISMAYSDINNDGLVDNTNLRVGALRILVLDETEGRWEASPDITIDTLQKRVSSVLRHFSVYGLFGSDAAASLGNVQIFPSPWKRGAGGAFDATELTFSALTETGVLRIYSLDNRLVTEIPYDTTNGGVVRWDGRNGDGAEIVSGVYFVRIEASTGESRILKFGVER